MKIKDGNLMTTIWLNTGSQQLLSGFATVELPAHACLYLLFAYIFSHWTQFLYGKGNVWINFFFFLRNSRGWLKEKIILNVLGKGSSSLLEPFPRSCSMAQFTSSLPVQDAHLELP